MWNVFSLHSFQSITDLRLEITENVCFYAAASPRTQSSNTPACLWCARPPARPLACVHTYPFRLLIGEDAALSACCEVAVNLEGVPWAALVRINPVLAWEDEGEAESTERMRVHLIISIHSNWIKNPIYMHEFPSLWSGKSLMKEPIIPFFNFITFFGVLRIKASIFLSTWSPKKRHKNRVAEPCFHQCTYFIYIISIVLSKWQISHLVCKDKVTINRSI